MSTASIADWQLRFAAQLRTALQHFARENTQAKSLSAAMHYSTFTTGGKRLRPLLVYAACATCRGDFAIADAAAVAVEYIHSYSLIHDDLPAMDNDDWRRGQPSCHRAFDEATAILAGDALQAAAFLRLLQKTPATTLSSMMQVLMIANQRMVVGQAMEMQLDAARVALDDIVDVYRGKTASLISAAMQLGALCNAEVSPAILAQMEIAGEAIGLAFQIQDDLLDFVDDHRATRDPVSYPEMVGIAAAKAAKTKYFHQACVALKKIPTDHTALRCLFTMMVHCDEDDRKKKSTKIYGSSH